MKNISAFIGGGAETLLLTNPVATYASVLILKKATIFWKFRNITDAIDNRKFVIKENLPGRGILKEKTLEEGYWDFQQIKERLSGEKLKLTANAHDNTCSIDNTTGFVVNLGKFGKLLGFPENHDLPKGVSHSPNPVDVNHGLRYLTLTCDLIDSSKNIGLDGRRSIVLAYLPVTPGTRLNSNCYVYNGDFAPQTVENSIVSKIVFTVDSNINEKVDVDVLLNLALE